MSEQTTTANPLALFDDPEVRAAFNAFAEACGAFVRLVYKAVEAAARIINSWWFTIKSTVAPSRWAHLARYARKKRTREKYQRMISRRWTELLRAVTTA
jgi:hypothetical protein